LCSRRRHCRRLWVLRCGHRVSTFLRPFAPPALPGFVATMDALTPVRPALRPVMSGNEHRPKTEQVSWLHVPGLRVVPSPTTWWAWPSLWSFSIVHRDQLPPPPPQRRQQGIRASPFPSRLAAATRPNRVRYPTDRRFTSGCSPPHLAVTQLPSVTGPRTWTWRGLTPLGPGTLTIALGRIANPSAAKPGRIGNPSYMRRLR